MVFPGLDKRNGFRLPSDCLSLLGEYILCAYSFYHINISPGYEVDLLDIHMFLPLSFSETKGQTDSVCESHLL